MGVQGQAAARGRAWKHVPLGLGAAESRVRRCPDAEAEMLRYERGVSEP